jgi:hypothetical protein
VAHPNAQEGQPYWGRLKALYQLILPGWSGVPWVGTPQEAMCRVQSSHLEIVAFSSGHHWPKERQSTEIPIPRGSGLVQDLFLGTHAFWGPLTGGEQE